MPTDSRDSRSKASLLEAFEAEGYSVSEEPIGYTRIAFSKGRFTSVNGDSFGQAVSSLIHDHADTMSAGLRRQAEHYLYTTASIGR